MKPIRLAIAIALSAAALAASAGERGIMGFGVSIDGDGLFLNPTLKTVTIDKVLPKSPAALAGLAVGDAIVEVEGHPVAGTQAEALKPYLHRDVGQATHLVVKRADGSTRAVVLTAVATSALE